MGSENQNDIARDEYIQNKMADVLSYYRIADKDIRGFLNLRKVRELRKLLITKDMSMEDIKKYLDINRAVYPLSALNKNTKKQRDYER